MRAPTPTERAAVFVGGFVAGHLLCRWLEARDRRARAAATPAWQLYAGDQRIAGGTAVDRFNATQGRGTGIADDVVIREYRCTYGADNPGAN